MVDWTLKTNYLCQESAEYKYAQGQVSYHYGIWRMVILLSLNGPLEIGF